MKPALRLSGMLIPLLLLLLTTSTSHADFPGLSGRIAFTSNEEGNSEIYLINPDGSGKINITRSGGEDIGQRWSPDGRKIAFWTQRDHAPEGRYEIYTMNANGTGQTRLTYTNAINGLGSWSPDGRKILFESDRDGNYEIYTMNADGSDPIRLTNNPAADLEPEYSPDGRQIVFTSDRSGHREIYVMNSDGTQPVRLTQTPEDNSQPRWSPDGKKIVFVSRRGAGVMELGKFDEIYVMNSDGSQQTRITNNLVSDTNPSWAPDGSRIVFRTLRYNSSTAEIALMNPDGTNPVRLTNSPAGAIAGDPNWQPVPILTVSRIDPSAVIGGEPATGSIRFNAVIPTGGLNIVVYSGDSRVSVPSLLTTIAGSDHIDFPVTTSRTPELFTADITVVVQGVVFNSSLTVLPVLPEVFLDVAAEAAGVAPPDRKLESQVLLSAAFPAPIAGEITLGFRPDPQVDAIDDRTVQFENLLRTIPFDVPPNSVLGLFPRIGTTIEIYTGTTAGTITLTLSKLETSGISILPRDIPKRVLSVQPSPPVITELSVDSVTTDSLDLVIAGYATTRSVLDGDFQFAGVNLQTKRLIVPLSDALQNWYRNPQSQEFGTRFKLRLTFNAAAGDARNVQSVSVSLRNAAGASPPLTVNMR